MTENTIYSKYLEIKSQYADCLVLMRIGDFFEAFNEDANKISDVLDLQLVSYKVDKNSRVDMAGFPANNLNVVEDLIGKLFDAGYHVALVEPVKIDLVKALYQK